MVSQISSGWAWRVLWAAVISAGLAWPAASWAQAESDEPASDEAVMDDAVAEEPAAEGAAHEVSGLPADADREVEQEFSRYLHFALIGQFEIADSYGKAFLARPQFNPLNTQGTAQLLMLTDKYKDSLDVLLTMVNHTSIGANAAKVLELIRQAHQTQRQAPARINESIGWLAGTPTQRAVAIERLRDSGEYAVPWLLEALADPDRASLRPHILKVLPQLGSRAMNPLLAGLELPDPAVRRVIVEALGQLRYAQSLPYLKAIATDPDANDAVREAAQTAIGLLMVDDKAARELPAADLFRVLAEQYYADLDSLRPDPREERANIWTVRDGVLHPIEVPRPIFHLVMAMRCAERALAMDADSPGTVALWLATNFRREAALGLDVESDEVAQTVDLTRPADFLRGVYFARMAGPSQCLRVLQRAIQTRDRAVALGAIAALRGVAGPAGLIDAQGQAGLSLGAALQFPDLLVRLRAALVLGAAMPSGSFRGAEDVVPTLASALSLTGNKFYLLVDPQDAARKAVTAGLQQSGGEVIVADRLGAGLDLAHKEFTHLDGIFLASDIERPTVLEALPQLAADSRFGLAPVVLYVKENNATIAEQAAQADPRLGRLLVVGEPTEALAQDLLEKLSQVATGYGLTAIDEGTSTSLALEAAGVLHQIAIVHPAAFRAESAEAALIAALAHPVEALRIACAEVLARLDSPAAQQAIAAIATAEDQTETLRLACYAALARSARQFGARLDAPMVDRLAEQAIRGGNLALRTAASEALGALNRPGSSAAQIILQNSK